MSYQGTENFDDNGLADREMPDRADMDDEDDDGTIPCPYCKRRIYEHSEFCPHCGKYISDEDAPAGISIWLIVGVAFALAGIIFGWVL